MQLLLAVSVVLAAAVFSGVESDSVYYAHEPRLFTGWGWGKRPIKVAFSKGWGWKRPTIKGIGLYGGIALHHGTKEGGGWGKVSSGGWGHGGGGGGGGWGWGPQVHHQQGWGWGHGGGGGGGKRGGWGGWGWDGHDDDDDGGWGWERSLPLERSSVVVESDSSAESGEIQSFEPTITDFNYPLYESVFE